MCEYMDMTTQSNSATAVTVLPDTVRQLKIEAAFAGDDKTVDDCNVVLGGSPGDDDYDAALGRLNRIIEGT